MVFGTKMMLTKFYNHNDYKNKYKACGVLFCKEIETKIYYLFVLEKRNNKNEMHIIGGKREDKEYPLLTASREMWEETNNLIDKIDCLQKICASYCKKYWYNKGKYILYVTKIDEKYYNIHNNYNMLVWMSYDDIKNNITTSYEQNDIIYNISELSKIIINNI